MKESIVEKYLVEQVQKRGGICEKHVSPGRRDVPDRLVTLRYQPMMLVELKAPGKKPRSGQLRDHARREALGIKVFVLDTKQKVDEWIHEYAIPGPSAQTREQLEFLLVEYRKRLNSMTNRCEDLENSAFAKLD